MLNAVAVIGRSPSASHHVLYRSYKSRPDVDDSGSRMSSSWRNRPNLSWSDSYSAVSASTAAHVPSPDACHSRQPRTAQARTADAILVRGTLSSALRRGSRSPTGTVLGNGTRLMRRQMASSYARGAWFVAIHSLNDGVNSKRSL